MSARRFSCATQPRRALASSLVTAAFALTFLAGCGGGGIFGDQGSGGGGGGAPPAVSIVTPSLPAAGLGTSYAFALNASGGAAPYAWSLAPGSTLPPGLFLSNAGQLSGTPAQLGSFAFSVSVLDAAKKSDGASYALVVSPFGATISLLHYGEAWSGEGYPLAATGASGTTFSLIVNVTGGQIQNQSPATSTARYLAGPTSGTDRVRATSTNGATVDIDVLVQPNPVAKMTARFSNSDVWHLRFDGKFDATHPYASDFDHALVILGMRSPSSTGATGTTADEVAKVYVRQQTLRYLNVNYHNNGDGSVASGGLAISFPFNEPDDPHVAPADGAITSPAVNQYNVISMIAGDNSGVIGTAWLDETSNNSQENDTTTAQSGMLGVFVDQIAAFMNGPYGNTQLPSSPVAASDLPALKALLYGTASPGGRYNELKRIGEGAGRSFAAVTAHEIGHSLGLNHTSPSVSGSIMNAAAMLSPSASYSFVASDLSILSGGLPGPGRGGSPQTVEALRIAAPGEGAPGLACQVCGCRVHSRVRR